MGKSDILGIGSVSDLAILGVLGFGLYTVSKSGILNTVEKVGSSLSESIEDLTDTSTSTVSNWIGWLPLGENWNNAVYNAGVWSGEQIGKIQQDLNVWWEKLW